MSTVTNVILILSVSEDEEDRIKEINSYFSKEDTSSFPTSKGLVSADDKSIPNHWYGGQKMLETNVYIGAFNGLDIEEFLEHLKSIKFEDSENVQVFYQLQAEDKFNLIEPFNVDIREYFRLKYEVRSNP